MKAALVDWLSATAMFVVGAIAHPVETFRGWCRRDEEWRPARELDP